MKIFLNFFMVFAFLFLANCATNNNSQNVLDKTPQAQDPWENLNRGTFAFNKVFDKLFALLDLHSLVKFIHLVGIKYEYEALILLKVGEFSPTETNCSVPSFNWSPEVGFAELFKLFLDVFATKLTNVFSGGHEPSFGENPTQIMSVTFPLTVVGVLSA